MSMKNYTLGNRTRDLPVCSAVPQPTAPPRVPNTIDAFHIFQMLEFSQKSIKNYQIKIIRYKNFVAIQQ